MSRISQVVESPLLPASLSMAGEFDVFIDLSSDGDLQDQQIAEHLALFMRRSGLATAGRRITLALPHSATTDQPGFSVPPGSAGEAFARALRVAGAARRGLLVVQGLWIPSNEVGFALSAYQHADPMIGTVQPRLAADGSDRIIGLPSAQGSPQVMLPRAALPYLPETFVVPELPAPLLLIVPRAVLAADAAGGEKFNVALAVLLVSLRRRGFRSLVCNRVVATYPLEAALAYPLPAIAQGADHHPWREDALRARAWLAAMPERDLETVLAAGVHAEGRIKVLLDCRGMQTFHNGTTHAITGYLDGITRLGTPGVEITLLTTAAAARFHDMQARYSNFNMQFGHPEGSFLVAIKLDQPWYLHTVVELHEHALFIAFNMLDTISWDVIFTAPPRLDICWRLLPRLADAFLFISNYSRDRFSFRFRPDPAIPLIVTHLSLDRDEVTRGCSRAVPNAVPGAGAGAGAAEGPYILIVGNGYDHKGLDPALATLSDAFPYTRIVAIGAERASSPQVTALPSGRISEAEIDVLVADAAVVVFPSYYEGFGLPVVHGLANGRTVLVRNAPLWNEIANHADLPGTLVAFEDEISLVEAVGRALHGAPLAGLTMGGALAGGSGESWSDCARPIMDLVAVLATERDGGGWIERQSILSQLSPAARNG